MVELKRDAADQNRLNFEMWIDAFRWMAAVAVLFTHVNNRLLVKILSLPHEQRHLPHYAFALIAGFGHQAVTVFFVLSGMLVGGSFLKDLKQEGVTRQLLLTYLVKRLARLWTVLIPALMLTGVLDLAGMHVFGGIENGIYTGEQNPQLGPGILICNIAFLQTAACVQYGTDGALWSLYNEFWYYIIWPLSVMAVIPAMTLPVRLAAAGAAVFLLILLTMFQFVGSSLAPYFLIWLAGVAVTLRDRSVIPGGIRMATGIFVLYLLAFRALVPTAWMDQTPGAWFLADMILALLFVNLLLALKACVSLRPPPLRALNTRLAHFSFSLYCVHTPIIMLFCAMCVRYTGMGWKMVPDRPVVFIYLAGAVITAVTGAYVFSRLTEAHTYPLRRFVVARLSQLFQPKALAGKPADL